MYQTLKSIQKYVNIQETNAPDLKYYVSAPDEIFFWPPTKN